MGDILPLEGDGALRHLISGVTGQRIAQSGLTGAVGAHEHMGLPSPKTQIDMMQDLLVLHTDRGVVHLKQQLIFHDYSFPFYAFWYADTAPEG